MTTFARPSLLDSRYAAIAETSAFTYDDDLVNYADFLRKHERYMTKSGYVDSSRRVRSLQRQQDDLRMQQPQSLSLRSSLPAAFTKSSLSSSSTLKKPKQSQVVELPSVISVSTNIEDKKREYDKQMRLIEDQMIKSKQNERESKRFEFDVKKEQRHLNHTLKELDVDTTKTRFDTDNYLSKEHEEKDRLKKKDQQPKQRIDQPIDLLQTEKEADRRNILVCNDLARQYRAKIHQLESKHQQLTQLHSDFDDKLQQKSVEENRVKKELGEIAMTLNLEARKSKADKTESLNVMHHHDLQIIKHDLEQEQKVEQKLNKTSVHVKNFALESQRLAGDFTSDRIVIDVKQREAARRIIDTKNRLDTIYARQRELNQEAEIVLQDQRAVELMTKIAEVDNRRTQLMDRYLREKIEREEEREAEGSRKAKVQYAEHETRQHEDHLRHFQKTVSKNDEMEYDLRESLRQAEFERRKQEHEVQKMKDELIQKKKFDAIRIRKEISRAAHEEKELEEQIVREKAKLDKLHSRREDSYLRLIKQRDQMRENKLLLETHEHEYERLLRVQARSQSLQSLNNF